VDGIFVAVSRSDAEVRLATARGFVGFLMGDEGAFAIPSGCVIPFGDDDRGGW
jgi:hypothetical protein